MKRFEVGFICNGGLYKRYIDARSYKIAYEHATRESIFKDDNISYIREINEQK